MRYRRRSFPHWQPESAAIFVTWRLLGSRPAPPPEWERLPAGKRFVTEDRALDRLATGERHLKTPAVARVVAQAIQYGADTLHLYDLHARVIMPNHVQMLIDPHEELAQITKSEKGYSAPQANQILNRTAQPFWTIESYDRWVRDLKEFENIIRYIEYNAVKAGLVENPEEWSSSAGLEACVTTLRETASVE